MSREEPGTSDAPDANINTGVVFSRTVLTADSILMDNYKQRNQNNGKAKADHCPVKSTFP
jgi:hypothetical protein